MATAARLDLSSDATEVPSVLRGAVQLGLIQAVCVFVVSLINRSLEGTPDHALTALVVAIGAAATILLPGLRTRPRTIEGIAGAAGIGLGATVMFLLVDVTLLQPLHTYTNRWREVGGGSNWWYHPVWWMVGTYLSWMGAWILANQSNKNGAPSVPGAIGLIVVLTALFGAVAAAVHFPLAGWNVPTFAVAVLPALALSAVVSGLGAKRG
ncbi:MAG: hypothetical protein ABIZ70_02630 [Gemmatimonadales bacterium]